MVKMLHKSVRVTLVKMPVKFLDNYSINFDVRGQKSSKFEKKWPKKVKKANF